MCTYLCSTRSQDCVARSQNLEIVYQSRDCAANLEIVQNFCIILRLHSFWAQSQDFTCTIPDPLHECKESAALRLLSSTDCSGNRCMHNECVLVSQWGCYGCWIYVWESIACFITSFTRLTPSKHEGTLSEHSGQWALSLELSQFWHELNFTHKVMQWCHEYRLYLCPVGHTTRDIPQDG